MHGYFFRRILQALILIGVLSFVGFYLLSLMPGDPIDQMITSHPQLTSEDIQRLRHLYALDAPVYWRYSQWVQELLHGDLGHSRAYHMPVKEVLATPFVNTLYLALSSLFLSLLLAIPSGFWAALRKGSRFDRAMTVISSISLSTPSFWLGILLILSFSVWWPLFPPGGSSTIGATHATFLDHFYDQMSYLFLPTLTLGFLQFGRFHIFMRSAVLDTLQHDYVRTALAKGLSRVSIFWRHIFKNSMIPLVTVIGMSSSSLFSGALITETVFSYQGMGKLLFDAIKNNDLPVAMMALMITFSFIVGLNLLIDFINTRIDPRISYE